MPMSRASQSTSAPPEFPGLIDASVWRATTKSPTRSPSESPKGTGRQVPRRDPVDGPVHLRVAADDRRLKAPAVEECGGDLLRVLGDVIRRDDETTRRVDDDARAEALHLALAGDPGEAEELPEERIVEERVLLNPDARDGRDVDHAGQDAIEHRCKRRAAQQWRLGDDARGDGRAPDAPDERHDDQALAHRSTILCVRVAYRAIGLERSWPPILDRP